MFRNTDQKQFTCDVINALLNIYFWHNQIIGIEDGWIACATLVFSVIFCLILKTNFIEKKLWRHTHTFPSKLLNSKVVKLTKELHLTTIVLCYIKLRETRHNCVVLS